MMGCHRVMGMLAMSRALGDVMIERYLSQVSLPLSLPLLYLNQVPLSLPPFLSSALARSLYLPLRYPPSRALLPVIPLTYAPC